jgi:hypothetical protein
VKPRNLKKRQREKPRKVTQQEALDFAQLALDIFKDKKALEDQAKSGQDYAIQDRS